MTIHIIEGASADGETVSIDDDGGDNIQLVSTFDCGQDGVGIDLIKVLNWVKKNRPDLLSLTSNGFCSEGDRCVCGGDTPRVRSGCANWRREAR